MVKICVTLDIRALKDEKKGCRVRELVCKLQKMQ